MTPQQALGRVFGARSDEVLQRAKTTAVKLAESLEIQHRHLLGEIGFDLGIDQDEDIWMFEANAKPGRSIFRHPPCALRAKLPLSTSWSIVCISANSAGGMTCEQPDTRSQQACNRHSDHQ